VARWKEIPVVPSEENYSTPETAAPSIREVVKFLREQDDGQYLYRGQVRDYPSPLAPSAYRNILASEPIYDPTCPEYQHSLRKIGRRFAGRNHAQFFAEEVTRAFPPEPLTGGNEEFELVRRLQNNRFFATSIAERGLERALGSALPPESWHKYSSRLPVWKKQIDSYHRIAIRNDAFLNAFGYVLGSTLAQQYGLSSEALDVTTDLNVAVFYATHAFPTYALASAEIGEAGGSRTGVIYRFPRPEASVTKGALNSYNYYSAPGSIVVEDVLRLFEVPGCTLSSSLQSFREYHDLRRATGERDLGRLRLPQGSVANGRVGRQHAAVIIPDELRDEAAPGLLPDKLGFGRLIMGEGQGAPVLASLEDIRYREGVRAYFFRHAGVSPDPEFTAQDLWPNSTDALLRIVAHLLTGGFQVCDEEPYVVPARVDLIDPGFGTIDFRAMADEISELTRDPDPVEAILQFAAGMEAVEGHLYLVRKAAELCHEGCIAADGDKLRTALAICKKTQDFDDDSMVLALLEHILYIVMGERGEGYTQSWAKAMKFAEGETKLAESIFVELYQMTASPAFPSCLFEYYQSL